MVDGFDVFFGVLIFFECWNFDVRGYVGWSWRVFLKLGLLEVWFISEVLFYCLEKKCVLCSKECYFGV